MTIRIHLFALATACLLAGCEASNVRRDFVPDSAPETAIIVGSVTQNADAGVATIATFYFNAGKGQLQKMVRAKKYNPIGPIAAKNEFKGTDSFGRLFVLELPAGRHVLSKWGINYGDGYGFSLYPKLAPPELGMSLAPGDIVYVGNLHMQVETGRNMLGFTIPVDGVPDIRNEQERDLALFRQQYPQLDARGVSVRLLPAGTWRAALPDESPLKVPKSD